MWDVCKETSGQLAIANVLSELSNQQESVYKDYINK